MLKGASGGVQDGIEARAMIFKLALATAIDTGVAAYRCPAWMRSAMGDKFGTVRWGQSATRRSRP